MRNMCRRVIFIAGLRPFPLSHRICELMYAFGCARSHFDIEARGTLHCHAQYFTCSMQWNKSDLPSTNREVPGSGNRQRCPQRGISLFAAVSFDHQGCFIAFHSQADTVSSTVLFCNVSFTLREYMLLCVCLDDSH